MSGDALVVGGGVNGLTTALRLREAGWRVRVWTAARWPDTVSRVAAAIWYPFRAYPADRVEAWGARAYEVFAGLAALPATGVAMVEGRVVWRRAEEAPPAGPALARPSPLPGEELPPGYAVGHRVTLPRIEMPVYLAWLESRFLAAGGTVEVRALRALDEALGAAPLVVNCTGLGARELVGDAGLVPIRGQVVRVENPGVEGFWLDESEGAVTYVIPRSRDVVLGGTAEEGAWDLAPDPDVARSILERCAALEPRLAGARVLGHAVGLRPGRPAVRLEREAVAGGAVVHNYGHGGSGVTVSWGCADEVVALARS